MEKRTRITRTCLLLFAVLCIQPALGVAGERPTGSAFQFGVGSSFGLTKLGGAAISYQRFLSKDLALRLGATIELDYDTVELTADGTGYYEGSGSDELAVWDNSLSLGCEWLAYRGSGVSLYFGGGPHISYDTRQSGGTSFYLEGDDRSWGRRDHVTSLSVGVTGVLGVQWAPAEWYALHVEYRAVAAYVRDMRVTHWYHAEESYEETRKDEQTNSDFEFDPMSVQAGVSIYF